MYLGLQLPIQHPPDIDNRLLTTGYYVPSSCTVKGVVTRGGGAPDDELEVW